MEGRDGDLAFVERPCSDREEEKSEREQILHRARGGGVERGRQELARE